MCYITAILWHYKTQKSYWNEVEFILALLFEKSEKGHNSQYNLDNKDSLNLKLLDPIHCRILWTQWKQWIELVYEYK